MYSVHLLCGSAFRYLLPHHYFLCMPILPRFSCRGFSLRGKACRQYPIPDGDTSDIFTLETTNFYLRFAIRFKCLPKILFVKETNKITQNSMNLPLVSVHGFPRELKPRTLNRVKIGIQRN